MMQRPKAAKDDEEGVPAKDVRWRMKSTFSKARCSANIL